MKAPETVSVPVPCTVPSETESVPVASVASFENVIVLPKPPVRVTPPATASAPTTTFLKAGTLASSAPVGTCPQSQLVA